MHSVSRLLLHRDVWIVTNAWIVGQSRCCVSVLELINKGGVCLIVQQIGVVEAL
jgi:hypothetical protein